MAITVDELVQRLIAAKTKMEGVAPEVAAQAMAEEGKIIVQTLLSHHGRGAPGMPPGMETGELRASITAGPAYLIGPGIAEAPVAPHTVYARVQEFGGPIWANRTLLRIPAGYGHPVRYKHTVYIYEHPYMRRMRQEGIQSGAFRQAAKDAFMPASGLDDI